MGWEKLGLIFTPDRNLYWQQSHAQNPFPMQISAHLFRIFFSSRDKGNISRTGFFDLDMREPSAKKNYSRTPVLDVGELGAFDDSGAMAHSIIKVDDEYFLYYTGWTKAVTVPFLFFIGLAKSTSLDGPFIRVSKAPVLGRNYYDPFLTSAPYVTITDNAYTMFYISGIRWEKEREGNIKHYYTAKEARSNDGATWKTNAKIIITLEDDEYAVARPVIFKDKSQYELWYSYRGGKNTYRMGLIGSKDLKTWQKLNLDFPLSETGWDSEMVCYGHPFIYNGKKYLLYNGNDYGRDGAGLAVLDE